MYTSFQTKKPYKMKYIRLIDDSALWKEEFEKNMKGKGSAEGDFYVINKSGRGDHVKHIPEVKEDIIMAKAKIASNLKRRYKRKGKVTKTQSKKKVHRGKKVAAKKGKGSAKNRTRKTKRKK